MSDKRPEDAGQPSQPWGTTGAERRPRLRWLSEVWGSTIGKKVLVAISGVILAAYVIGHALGNLKALQGAGGGEAAIDKYAEWLRTVGAPAVPREGLLWSVRALLVVALVIHVVGVIQLIKRNRSARPEGYRSATVIQRSLSSRTMALSGFVVLAFIVFHILHFTTRTIHPTDLAEGTVYANLYGAFQDWWMVGLYVGVMGLLFFHLRHALWSLLQTFGWDQPNRNPTFRRGATTTAILVAAGFAAIPLAFWLGVLPEPGGGGEIARQAGASAP